MGSPRMGSAEHHRPGTAARGLPALALRSSFAAPTAWGRPLHTTVVGAVADGEPSKGNPHRWGGAPSPPGVAAAKARCPYGDGRAPPKGNRAFRRALPAKSKG